MEAMKNASSAVFNGMTRWYVSSLGLYYGANPTKQEWKNPELVGKDRLCPINGNNSADLWGFYRGASCKNLHQLAGLSGVLAIAFAAYGWHVINQDVDGNELRQMSLINATTQHTIHTVGLLISEGARYPLLTAMFFASGIVVYCGPCYAFSIWKMKRPRMTYTAGVILLSLGWLSFIA
ncbi:hypothetical protein DdX_03029 [Ditylenchus destructor]|uniref:Uncharacterized protein n=1 Tax=Ditylenchus destructor TaxID=166010 RepID=A0AAD4R9M7_9BILA|nr:hypothetical protein DdX_03029 [Ditylenchus destructor]